MIRIYSSFSSSSAGFKVHCAVHVAIVGYPSNIIKTTEDCV